MNLVNIVHLCSHLVRTRWLLRFRDRKDFDDWQQRQIQNFLDKHLRRSPFYRNYAGKSLEALPIVDKKTMLRHFDEMNTVGMTLDEATAIALLGETTRDFTPGNGDITVGLSSGTQGTRGAFLVSSAERARWAGIMMARVLPDDLLHRLLVGVKPIKVAFFLRASSNLYTTLKSRRVDFRFYDLLQGVDVHLHGVTEQAPDILVAPARILSRLAEHMLNGRLPIKPRRVIAVAEVLEADDQALIAKAFGEPVHQLYQCTEGFLGYTCERGVMHLNEEFVHIEPQWLDAERTRFVPIVTDFSRTTQLIVRYRLDDILRVRRTPCGCGALGLALDAVEGRCDDVLWLPEETSAGLTPLYPDMMRYAVTSARICLPDYRIEQHGMEWHVAVADEELHSYETLVGTVQALLARHRLIAPAFHRISFVGTDAHVKRRRILCAERPVSNGH